MKKSRLTQKIYDETNCIYMTNPLQCHKFLQYFNSAEYLLDILWDSSRRPDALVYVWERCPVTSLAKKKWDAHEL